jgi:hypothetical protein
MSRTGEGARLTEAHRVAQARLGAETVRDVLALWPLLDPEAIDATVERWLRAVVPYVGRQQARSAELSKVYVETFRAVELGAPVESTVEVVSPARAAAVTSLSVTGPVKLKQLLGRAVPVERAVQDAAVSVSRSAMRVALAGGRETVAVAVRSDREALGWARATSARPCGFCAMLASRGPVYKQDTALFTASGSKFHDACACTAEPVYGRDADWPPGARELRRLWDESTAGLSQQDAVNAFRRALPAG